MSGRCPEQLEGPDGRIRTRRRNAIEARNFLQNILDNSSDDEFSVEEEPDSDLDLDDDIEFRPEIRSSSRSSSNAEHDGEEQVCGGTHLAATHFLGPASIATHQAPRVQ